jgi:hypothetical protein
MPKLRRHLFIDNPPFAFRTPASGKYDLLNPGLKQGESAMRTMKLKAFLKSMQRNQRNKNGRSHRYKKHEIDIAAGRMKHRPRPRGCRTEGEDESGPRRSVEGPAVDGALVDDVLAGHGGHWAGSATNIW